MSKITMALAFGAGYVVGARAGRERYDELRSRANELWNNPTVQEQAGKVQEQAGKVQDQAKQRLPGSHEDSSVEAQSSGSATAPHSAPGRFDG